MSHTFDKWGTWPGSTGSLAGVTTKSGSYECNWPDVFDKTLQTTNIRLDEIVATLGPDRQLAWKVLSVVLHKPRERLPIELSAHLSAELPLLVRGVYYDQFEPAKLIGMIQTFTDSMTARMGARRLMRLHLIVAVHLYRSSCAGYKRLRAALTC